MASGRPGEVKIGILEMNNDLNRNYFDRTQYFKDSKYKSNNSYTMIPEIFNDNLVDSNTFKDMI